MYFITRNITLNTWMGRHCWCSIWCCLLKYTKKNQVCTAAA